MRTLGVFEDKSTSRSCHVRVFIHPIHRDHAIVLTHGARPGTAAELRRDARLERRLRVRHADVRTPTREIGLVRVLPRTPRGVAKSHGEVTFYHFTHHTV